MLVVRVIVTDPKSQESEHQYGTGESGDNSAGLAIDFGKIGVVVVHGALFSDGNCDGIPLLAEVGIIATGYLGGKCGLAGSISALYCS